MAMDAWAREIFEAFVKVLRRPRYNLKVGEISNWVNFYEKGFTVNIITPWEETLKLNMYYDKNKAKISCFGSDNENEPFEMTGFHYSITFDKRASEKVRKAATIFAEKIKQKPVYDVMNN
jgi:hypothetical protein